MSAGRTSSLPAGRTAAVASGGSQKAGGAQPSAPSSAATVSPQLLKNYGNLPLQFEANQGQTDPQVQFLARGPGYTLFLTASGAALTLARPTSAGAQAAEGPSFDAVGLTFAGANPNARVTGLNELPGRNNYFTGSDTSGWRTNVTTYGSVQVSGLYAGVDLVYHGSLQGQLEYDFVVAPGADPSLIKMSYQGAAASLDSGGKLVLRTASGGQVVQQTPTVYQMVGGVRQDVNGWFVQQSDGSIGLGVGAHDASQPLIIDPVLEYFTVLGGSVQDQGLAVAVDGDGQAYLTGSTASTNFPTLNPFQGTRAGAQNAFVAKLNAAGNALDYATYLGGNGTDQGNGIAVDAAGNAYLVGATTSTNFPVQNAYQAHNSP